MAYVVLYTVTDPDTGMSYTIQYDDTDNSIFSPFLIMDADSVVPPIVEGQRINAACNGTTLVTFYEKKAYPYAYTEFTTQSGICGYTPPTCDLYIKTLKETDETESSANDGTINIFAVSSYDIDYYFITGPVSQTNSTGVFTGLPPGVYNVLAADVNGCKVNQNITINASLGRTHLKYVLQFNTVLTNQVCRLEIYDQNHTYSEANYPKYLIGSPTPVIKKTTNTEEDKTAAILPTSLAIQIIFDGATFTMDEFALGDERTWYVKYIVNGAMDFQGWLIPDETQDFYKDAKYYVQLTATDGLLSLKGPDYGDASGIQEYGLFTCAKLIKNCLDKLDYDYGLTTLISSLMFNNVFDPELWTKISTWADLFYDDNGLPQDTYTVLDTLLSGLGLSIVQDNGIFCLISWNDLFYIQNPIKSDDWKKSVWQFNANMDGITNMYAFPGVPMPVPNIITVGYGLQCKPINPDQSLNYDKAYNVLAADIDFSFLTLLYANPSFEIGAVEGALPLGFKQQGDINTYLHKDANAYVGDWEYVITGHPHGPGTDSHFADQIAPGFVIDQLSKTFNVSFYWKPDFYDDTWSVNAGPLIVYIDSFDSRAWIWIYAAGDINAGWLLVDDLSTVTGGMPPTKIEDYLAWNNYTINTTQIPGSGLGSIYLRLYAGEFSNGELSPSGKPSDSITRTYRIDQLEITLGDASDSYNKQIGETHTVTNATNYAKAEKKTIQQSLFTFPTNKRIAGNVFYGDQYLTGIVANTWNFALSTPTIIDKLPAVIIRQAAKQYQRPVYIFEGDVQFTALNYFAVFILKGYESRIFMPYTIERDDRNNTAHMVLIEIDDTTPQNTYIYTGKYEKSARKITS